MIPITFQSYSEWFTIESVVLLGIGSSLWQNINALAKKKIILNKALHSCALVCQG